MSPQAREPTEARGGFLSCRALKISELKISAPSDIYKSLSFFNKELKYILITSKTILKESKKDLEIEVNASENSKCERCWHYVEDIGSSSEHPTICKRCISSLFEGGEERKHA